MNPQLQREMDYGRFDALLFALPWNENVEELRLLFSNVNSFTGFHVNKTTKGKRQKKKTDLVWNWMDVEWRPLQLHWLSQWPGNRLICTARCARLAINLASKNLFFSHGHMLVLFYANLCRRSNVPNLPGSYVLSQAIWHIIIILKIMHALFDAPAMDCIINR